MMTAADDAAAQGSQPRTILFVDDEVVICMVAAGMIGDMGYRVLQASSAAKALELLDKHPGIDLLITDFSMPRMSGVELIREARRRRPGLPALLASGHSELPGDAAVDAVQVMKPFEFDSLAELIAASFR
jgi:DNA-binding NtrC family response regulator